MDLGTNSLNVLICSSDTPCLRIQKTSYLEKYLSECVLRSLSECNIKQKNCIYFRLKDKAVEGFCTLTELLDGSTTLLLKLVAASVTRFENKCYVFSKFCG